MYEMNPQNYHGQESEPSEVQESVAFKAAQTIVEMEVDNMGVE
jgi:hypothetical protein